MLLKKKSVLLHLVLGFSAFIFLYFVMLGNHGLLEPDEGRYSQIPREMILTGDWVTPRQNGVLYFEKPALHYWLTAAAFESMGQNEFASRFWPALLGLLTLPIVFFMGRHIYNNTRAGTLSAAILGTTLLHFALAHINLTDMTLSFFLSLSLAGLWFSSLNRSYLLLFYTGMALAVLTKGLVGIVLPCGIAFWYILLTRRWDMIRRCLYLPGILLFCALTIPWFWVVCQRNPGFFDFFFIQEHFLRYTTQIHDRYEPAWFFIPILLAGLVPWTGWLPSALREARAQWSTYKDSTLFLLCWCLIILLFFSLSSSKLIPYILPCLPPLSILIGGGIHSALEGKDRKRLFEGFIGSALLCIPLAAAFLIYPFFQHRIPCESVFPVAATLALCLSAGTVIPLYLLHRNKFKKAVCVQVVMAFLFCLSALPLFGIIAENRSAKGLAAFIEKRLQPGDVLAEFNIFDQGLSFYLNRRVALIEYKGELEFGSRFPEAQGWFFTKKEFNDLLNKRGVLLIMEKNAAKRFFDGDTPQSAITEEYGKYLVVTFPAPEWTPR